MNIGVFSGSFDPVHIGHLVLANYITEFTEIDEVWFLVSPQNPLKKDRALSDEMQRLKMVELALSEYPNLRASDFEFSLPRPSYTVNTLDMLSKKHPEHNFSLVIGADNWSVFDNWKNYEEIISRFNIKVYPRLGCRISIPPTLRESVEALESPIIEISSTFIRESISSGKDMRAFLPCEVYEFVEQHGLYK